MTIVLASLGERRRTTATIAPPAVVDADSATLKAEKVSSEVGET
jgi:hypothetical protein